MTIRKVATLDHHYQQLAALTQPGYMPIDDRP
jgi:hypothetical protein